MKWHKVSDKPFPIQETFIAGFEVVRNGNSFFEPCVVYCRDYDSEIIDVFNDCPCGWDDKDITYWAKYSEPQEFKEAETQPITQAKAAEALPDGEIVAFVKWVASLSKIEYAAHRQLVDVIERAQQLPLA